LETARPDISSAQASGKPMSKRNVYRDLESHGKRLGIEQKGFHAFRRFRRTWLEKNMAVKDTLIKFWLGHGPRDVTDLYLRLVAETDYRREVAEAVGLGFNIPLVVANVARMKAVAAAVTCGF
jgi:integrase